MFIVITYDIPDDKRRAKIAKALEDYGSRVQYSVFECNLTEEQFARLRKRLRKHVPDDGSIRYYKLCSACVRRIEIDGIGEVTKDAPYYIV